MFLFKDRYEAKVIPADRIELSGLRFVEKPAELRIALDFSSQPTGRPEVILHWGPVERDLGVTMDDRLPFGAIPDTTVQLSDMLKYLWGCQFGAAEVLQEICETMVHTVITVNIKKDGRDNAKVTCKISGYNGEATCSLADLSILVEAIP